MKLGFRLWEELGDWAHVAACVVGDGLIQGELTVYPGALEMTTWVINELADSYPTSAYPKSECSCGTFCTSRSGFQDRLHHFCCDDEHAIGLSGDRESNAFLCDVDTASHIHTDPSLYGRGHDEFGLKLPFQSPSCVSTSEYLSTLRESIAAQYARAGVKLSFGEILCSELHRRDDDFPDGMTFQWLADKWGIAPTVLGALISDHCMRLEPLPTVKHGYRRC